MVGTHLTVGWVLDCKTDVQHQEKYLSIGSRVAQVSSVTHLSFKLLKCLSHTKYFYDWSMENVLEFIINKNDFSDVIIPGLTSAPTSTSWWRIRYFIYSTNINYYFFFIDFLYMGKYFGVAESTQDRPSCRHSR